MKSKSYEAVAGQHKKTIQVLNDLVRINIDRVAGYERAAHEEKNTDPILRDLFYRLATDSRSYVNDLHAEIIRLGGAPVTQSTITGKIYLHWLDGKNVFEGDDVRTLLNTCSTAETAVQKAYDQALDTGNSLPENICQLIESQSWSLERACERLQAYSKNAVQHDQYDRSSGS
jgi:uncharacterized protein (TIGR02284 family)